jgi:anhydro-N-acetylmuramic acid kinase
VIVAGIMSGTSADGIDVALVRLTGRGLSTRLKLLAHRHFAYPAPLREKILNLMNGSAPVSDLALLNFLLGELYAQAVIKTRRTARLPNLALIGCHGQTLYHQGEPQNFLGRKLACTWQTGEAAIIAARIGVPVISDFRPADMAAGGKGAPLVPYLDYLLFRHPRRGRILQNIGGIANLTALPPNPRPQDVIAFDTGPGNMVVDAVTSQLFGLPFDRDGKLAARGRVITPVITKLLRDPFFRQSPPRTAGREEFGSDFAQHFIQYCKSSSVVAVSKEDIVTTATELTVASIVDSLARFVLQRKHSYRDFIVSGGGASNRTLMRSLSQRLAPLGLDLETSTQLGLPSQAKEAVAFALLAYQTMNGEPSNLPSATGARGPAILGKLSLPSVPGKKA